MQKLVLKYLFLIYLLLFFNLQLSYSQQFTKQREVRGVWLTTAFCTDWPSKVGLSTEQQKKEMISYLDSFQKVGINTVFFQVRPAGDAFYSSQIEPWSRWLTGTLGEPPSPFYDPLAFVVEECHKRDMEIHAWFNPYRSYLDSSKVPKKDYPHPEWLVLYGNRYYLDPALPQVRAHVTKVVCDVVRRYDIDGVHFDDYFYPYPIGGVDFPDQNSFKKYKGNYTSKSKKDWRRNNVDLIIKMLNDSIEAVKPYVKFGISPFGVWRNKGFDPDGSDTRALSNYDDLYADILKWLKNGWIDYIAPQLYWYIGNKSADYCVVLDWWMKHLYGRHFYAGHSVSNIFDTLPRNAPFRNPSEIPNQLRYNKKHKNVMGSVFYSSKTLQMNPLGFCDTLKNNFYKNKVLPQSMPWIDSVPPNAPRLYKRRQKGQTLLFWVVDDEIKRSASDEANRYYIYRFEGKQVGDINDEKNIFAVVKSAHIRIDSHWGLFRKKYTYVVTAFDRLYNESEVSNALIIKTK